MSWFHYTKQERLQHNRKTRREMAEQARKDASDNPWIIKRTVDEAYRLACEEERLFEDYFGEPLPNHLAAALHLEMTLWRRLQASIENKDASKMTDAHAKEWTEAIRTVLLQLIDLLHAEEEMLTSCLVQHYTTILKELQAASARVTL